MIFDLIKNLAASNEGSEGEISVSEDILKALIVISRKKGLKIKITMKDLGGMLYMINSKVLCDIAKEINDEDRNIVESASLVSLADLVKTKSE